MAVGKVSSVNDPLLGPYDPYVYKRRWVMLALFAVASAYCSIMQFAFAGIQNYVEEYYKPSNHGKPLSSFAVETLALIYMGIAVPVTFLAQWVMHHWGLTISVHACVIINLASCWIRYLGRNPDGFWVLWGGQLLGSVGMPFVLVAPTLLASNWFPDKERALATSVGALGGILGQGGTMAMSGAIVSKPSLIPRLLLIQAIIATALCALTVAIFRGTPARPPSRTSSSLRDKSETFWRDLYTMFHTVPFWICLIGFAVTYGGLGAFSTLINPIITNVSPDEYTADFASYVGAAAIGAGCVGAVVCGIVLDITRRYKLVTVGVLVAAVGCFVWFNLALQPHNKPMIYTVAALAGFFAVATIPAFYELAVEVTYPTPEQNSTGVLTLVGQGVVFGFVPLLNALKDPKDETMTRGIWVLTGGVALSTLLVLCFRGRYRRYEAEQAFHVDHSYAA